MLTRRTVILAGRETTYGTDPALTGSNGFLAWDVDLDIKGEILKRDVLRDSLSSLASVIGMKECSVNFKTELKNLGLVGTAQNATFDNALLLTGCGFNTGVLTGTTLVMSLVSDETAINSLSFLVEKDGNWHKVVGSRGSVKFNLEAGKYGVAEWSFNGLYNAVVAGTIHSLSNQTTNKPPIVYNSSFQIAGFSPVCSSAEIDLANSVTRVDSLNATYGVQSFRITDRKPTLSFDADAVVEASNPFWGDWSGDVVDTFSVQIGSVAGNIVKISGIFKYDSLKYGDKDGVSKYDCKAMLCSSTATSSNDELTITHI